MCAAEYLRAAGLPSRNSPTSRETHVLLVPGDGRGRRATRRSVPGVGRQDGAKRFGRSVHEVGPVAAVDVQIDEAGEQIAALQIDDGQAGGRAFGGADVLNAVVEREQLAIGEQAIGRTMVPLMNRNMTKHLRRRGGAGTPIRADRFTRTFSKVYRNAWNAATGVVGSERIFGKTHSGGTPGTGGNSR